MAMTLTIADGVAASAAQPHVTILTDRCAGCQECVIRCPAGALTMETARWVAVADEALCVGCRQCERTCPFGAITVEGPLLVADRVDAAPRYPDQLNGDTSETRPGFSCWDDALAEANRCLDCPDPTCVRGCPAHNDIPSFIAAIRDRDLGAAHDVLRLTSVLPDICSRVCDQAAQCEGACTWSLAGGTPVAIGKLERFVADHAPVPPPARADSRGTGPSVAVVGSGPAGIGAAWHLAEAGASVTVYERESEPGGLLGWGIPGFTLPADVAGRPWRQLVAAGVDLHCGTEIGPDDVDTLLADHDAVILAHGAGTALRLPVPGGDLCGVTDATTFLKAGTAALQAGEGITGMMRFLPAGVLSAGVLSAGALSAEAKVSPPQVLVLGAGNTAMDVARTARRLGFGAVCVDWVAERYALARPDEIAEARHEGVEIRFLSTVACLEGENGRVSRAALARTRQTRPDRKPKILRGSPEMLKADLVVMAMGYRGDRAFAEILPGTPVVRTATGVPDRRWVASGMLASPASDFAFNKPVGRLALGRETGLASSALPFQERLWAAGDALVGPSTVVEAMAHGRRAAASVLGTRPSRGARGEPRRVLVGYESRGGRTARAAGLIAEKLRETGAVVRAVPLAQIGADDLMNTDLFVLGTWVEGFVVAGVGPARAARDWLGSLPRLAGLRTATFCTYSVSSRGTLPALRRALERRGMIILAEGAFGPRARDIESAAAQFSARLLATVWPAGVLHSAPPG
jgi:glutamate synthase (NADPH) small chain